jgi:hypothetical protein
MAELSKSLAAAAAQLTDPPALAKNAHFGQPYADLKAVVQSLRQPLAKNGLSVVQSPAVRCRRRQTSNNWGRQSPTFAATPCAVCSTW